MDYNDIIIIMLLIIIIIALGLILLKKELKPNEYFNYDFSNQSLQNTFSKPYSYNKPNNIEYIKYDSNQIGKYSNFQKINENNNYNLNQGINQGISINDKLVNIKNNKNKNSVILKNKNSKYDNKKFLIDDNNKNFDSLNDNTVDLQSLEADNLNYIKRTNKKIKKYKGNDEIKRKVIIDDYSEYDNIKSLNSMDNTLSDLISIVEKDK